MPELARRIRLVYHDLSRASSCRLNRIGAVVSLNSAERHHMARMKNLQLTARFPFLGSFTTLVDQVGPQHVENQPVCEDISPH